MMKIRGLFAFALIAVVAGAACTVEYDEDVVADESIDQIEDAIAAPSECTDHQGCFYVDKYSGGNHKDPTTWTYHAKNCVVIGDGCGCPAITPWTNLLNTCADKSVEEEEGQEAAVE